MRESLLLRRYFRESRASTAPTSIMYLLVLKREIQPWIVRCIFWKTPQGKCVMGGKKCKSLSEVLYTRADEERPHEDQVDEYIRRGSEIRSSIQAMIAHTAILSDAAVQRTTIQVTRASSGKKTDMASSLQVFGTQSPETVLN
jgi:hypothetical protein